MVGRKVFWSFVVFVSLIVGMSADGLAAWGGKCGNASCAMCYGTRYHSPQPRTVYEVVKPKMKMSKAVWTCPMHPRVKSDCPARCSVCGMDLVRTAKKKMVHKQTKPNPKAATPQAVVDEMLRMAGVRREDLLVDLGCGDGRIVITAARRYGCRAGGHDVDPAQVELARANVARSNVARLINIGRNDVLNLDISMATVVTVYLPADVLGKLMPKFRGELKAGSRIVSHNHPLPGARVNETRVVRDKAGRRHTLYLYVVPMWSDFGMIR